MLDHTFRPHLLWPATKHLVIKDGVITYGAKSLLLADVAKISYGEIQKYRWTKKTNRWSRIFLAAPDQQLAIRFDHIGWTTAVRTDIQGLYQKILAELFEPVIMRLAKSWAQSIASGHDVHVGRIILKSSGLKRGNVVTPWKDVTSKYSKGYVIISTSATPKPIAQLNMLKVPNAVVVPFFIDLQKGK